MVRRLLVARFALLAILLNTLMPTVAHAITFWTGEPSFLMEICAKDGRRFIRPNEAESLTRAPNPTSDATSVVTSAKRDTKLTPLSDVDQTSLSGMNHCPYCLHYAHSPWLLPSQLTLPVLSGDASHFPPLFYQSPTPLFIWATANPRAPPASL